MNPGDLATPAEIAKALHTTVGQLSQMRSKGTGPKFVKVGQRVLYRWSDVSEYLDANTRYTTREEG